ncbi:hsp70 nucleotide exchange factor FES1 [Iris pallida]|uniref:Hsp70 nucleotide exchange factor FES1 n=1 Tax=Iris pallida TaxID=29817 RepID=A0AAX6H2L3_IRIPA|nr:hsp70 nucleotide exchange factor FES1 [Iris pallida]
MGRLFSFAVVGALLFLVASVVSAVAAEEGQQRQRPNKTSYGGGGGIFWATDDGDLLSAMESDDPSASPDDDLAGAFSSLDSMLQWAIGHSDPEKLRDKANDVQRLSANDLQKRQVEIKELMERLKVPSDSELMQISIADLNNSSTSLEDRQHALNELLILVESIDNANDLSKLGGYVAVVQELHNSEPGIRTTSAWIIGMASQNNALILKQDP